MKTIRRLRILPDPEAPASARLRVFASLWALAAIVHLLNNGQIGLTHPSGWLTLMAAIALITRPSSVARFAFFAAVQILEVLWISPFTADHQILMALVNLAFLVTIGIEARAAHGLVSLPAADELMARTIVPARMLLLLAYSAAAFSKYNSTFLDPVTSCATLFAELGSGDLLSQKDGFSWVFVVLAIGSETAIAISLAIPRLRPFGVRYGIAFHCLITASPLVGVEDFSLTLDALLMLFATERDLDRLLTSAQRALDTSSLVAAARRLDRTWLAPLTLFPVIAATATFAAAIVPLLLWWTGLLVAGWLLFALLRRRRETASDMGAPLSLSEEPPSTMHRIAIVMMIIVIISPYVGLRTVGAFTMFSNLRTAGVGDNHYLAPSWDFFGLQDDLFTPAAGSSKEFDDLVEDGLAIAGVEAARVLDKYSGSVLIGDRNGEWFDSRTDDIEVPPALVTWFLLFRPVPASGSPVCSN